MKTGLMLVVGIYTALCSSVFADEEAAVQSVECGVKGSIAKRIKSCRAVYGKQSTRSFIYVSAEAASHPLIDAKQRARAVWQLVSAGAQGSKLWQNELTGQYWLDTSLSFDDVVPLYVLTQLALECDMVARSDLKLGYEMLAAFKFDLPSSQVRRQASQQGLRFLTRENATHLIVRDESHIVQFEAADTSSVVSSADIDAIIYRSSLLCVGSAL